MMGAVRLRQIRLQSTNCLVGKTKITSSLDVFKGTDCHGTTTLENIARTQFGPGTIKNYTKAPMVERSPQGYYTYQSTKELAHLIAKDGKFEPLCTPYASPMHPICTLSAPLLHPQPRV